MWFGSQEPEGLERSAGGSPKLKDVLERKKTYREHRDFLASFQNFREVKEGGREEGMG